MWLLPRILLPAFAWHKYLFAMLTLYAFAFARCCLPAFALHTTHRLLPHTHTHAAHTCRLFAFPCIYFAHLCPFTFFFNSNTMTSVDNERAGGSGDGQSFVGRSGSMTSATQDPGLQHIPAPRSRCIQLSLFTPLMPLRLALAPLSLNTAAVCCCCTFTIWHILVSSIIITFYPHAHGSGVNDGIQQHWLGEAAD